MKNIETPWTRAIFQNQFSTTAFQQGGPPTTYNWCYNSYK